MKIERNIIKYFICFISFQCAFTVFCVLHNVALFIRSTRLDALLNLYSNTARNSGNIYFDMVIENIE